MSVPSNIAEGAARQSGKEFLKFLAIARGSLAESETQLIIAERLGYLSADEPWRQPVENIFGKLGSLIKSLQI
ncbi:four helix bundle protein, partial [Acinetobacter baumannii]